MGSSPHGRRLLKLFQQFFNLNFMLGQVNFIDIAILCNRPKNCCQQNFKCFDEPLFSLGVFSRGGFELSPLVPGTQLEINILSVINLVLSGETIICAHAANSHF